MEYIEGYGTTIILLLGAFSMSIFKILNPLYQSLGQWKLYVGTLLVSVIINTFMNVTTIPSFGIYGAAIASVVSYSVCGLVLLMCFLHDYKIHFNSIVLISLEDARYYINKFKISINMLQ